MSSVTLHIRTEPYEEDDFDGNKVVGEVKRGGKVLHTVTVITDNGIESVCGAKDEVGLKIELWAVQNTDFMPTVDALPA